MSDPSPISAQKAPNPLTGDRRRLLPIAEAAALVGISRMTVYRRIRSGAWPSGRCGRNHLVPRAFIEGLVAEIETGRKVDHVQYAKTWFEAVGTARRGLDR